MDVTLLMPQRAGRSRAERGRRCAIYFEVEGDFRLIQRPSRWAGEALARTLLWLRQAFRDPALAGADLLYSRIPAMLAHGRPLAAPLRRPTITVPGPTICRSSGRCSAGRRAIPAASA